MAATPSMPITDTARDRRPLVLFDDENRAKVRRPIGTIDDDGWTFVTYGPLDVWGAHPIENPNDMWADFTQAANNFVQAVNNFVQAANAPTVVACVDGELRIYAKRSRVAAFLSMSPPNSNKRTLLGALSSASWWRNSIRGFGHIAKLLYALCGDANNVKQMWNSTHDKAWNDLKIAIATAT